MSIERTGAVGRLVVTAFAVCARWGKFCGRVVIGRWQFARLRHRSQPWPERSANAVTLVFSPHQDDSTLGCGGLIAHRLARTETVYVAYITDGAASHPGHPVFSPAMIASMRADEARIAAGILGIPSTNLVFLKAPDSRLPHLRGSERATLVAQILALITRLAPDEVFCTSRHDGSTEHAAACALLREALNNFGEARPRLVEYIVWSRWNPRWLRPALRASSIVHRQVLSASESKLKRDAVNAYRSQVAPLPPWLEPVLPAYFTRVFSYPEEYFFIFKN